MQTTLRLPDDLYAEVKRRAAQEGITVTAFLEGALRLRLGASAPDDGGRRYRVKSHGADGLRAGIDLDDMASVRDAMDDQ